MKKLLTILFTLLAGCNQPVQPVGLYTQSQVDSIVSGSNEGSGVVYVDNMPGQNDLQKITNAINAAKSGFTVQFGNRTYSVNHTIAITKNITLRGEDSTVITRENAVVRHLAKAAGISSTNLTLDNTDDIEVGDYVIIYDGIDWLQSTEPILVRGKLDNVLYMSDVPKFRNNTTDTFPAGMKVLKSFTMLLVYSNKDVNSAAPKYANIENITIDGNKVNNSENLRYNINMGLMVENRGRTSIKNCRFINMPTECIVGHNADIDNNIFLNNNGSIFHGSINRLWINENEIVTNIRGNVSDSSNLISTTISGHSEGLLTTSNSGGHVTAIGNRFSNIMTAAVIGALYPALPYNPADWGTSDYIFTGNVVNNAKRICYLVDSSNAVNRKLVNIYIANNYLYSVGKMSFDGYFEKYPQMYIDQRNINELPK